MGNWSPHQAAPKKRRKNISQFPWKIFKVFIGPDHNYNDKRILVVMLKRLHAWKSKFNSPKKNPKFILINMTIIAVIKVMMLKKMFSLEKFNSQEKSESIFFLFFY